MEHPPEVQLITAHAETGQLLDDLHKLHIRRLEDGVLIPEAVDHKPYESYHQTGDFSCPLCDRIYAIVQMKKDHAEGKHEDVDAALAKDAYPEEQDVVTSLRGKVAEVVSLKAQHSLAIDASGVRTVDKE